MVWDYYRLYISVVRVSLARDAGGHENQFWKVGPRAELKMWGPYIMNCRRNQWVFPWGFHETPRNQWSYICFLLAGDGAQLVKIVFLLSRMLVMM